MTFLPNRTLARLVTACIPNGRRDGSGARVRRVAAAPELECLEDRRLLSAGLSGFPIPADGTASHPGAIATGTDGNLWFTDGNRREIGRVTPGGDVQLFSTGGLAGAATPVSIAPGPDGAAWFTLTGDGGGAIGRITTDGRINAFAVSSDPSNPAGPDTAIGPIAAGPDGALWFTETGDGTIDRITTEGALTAFPLPNPGSRPDAITAGPDGALWFTEEGAIGRITTDGQIREFPLVAGIDGTPRSIAAGPDGALWFTEAGAIGRLTTNGQLTRFALPDSTSSPNAIAAGPDGALWFTDSTGDAIGRITPFGEIREFGLGSGFGLGDAPFGITSGPDSALWFTETGAGVIGRLDPQGIATATGATTVAPSFGTPSDATREGNLPGIGTQGSPTPNALIASSPTASQVAPRTLARHHTTLPIVPQHTSLAHAGHRPHATGHPAHSRHH